ncbi:type II toxin-antitoxin system RelE/ParE family toxin, partial [Escherichia coli]|uniref:type II toxin-antitoxin system RelE/ParE family toxin n=1 Tax=Escherichia coli TaxID=562 RepID=UPI0039E0F1FF
ARIWRASQGNFGDCEPVGDGVSEMRIDYGSGYRVYFAREADVTYLLLCGGNKSTQARDIVAARELWNQLKKS